MIGAPNEIDEEDKVVRRNIWFPKSILLTGFGEIEIRVQILGKKTVLPSKVKNQVLEPQMKTIST